MYGFAIVCSYIQSLTSLHDGMWRKRETGRGGRREKRERKGRRGEGGEEGKEEGEEEEGPSHWQALPQALWWGRVTHLGPQPRVQGTTVGPLSTVIHQDTTEVPSAESMTTAQHSVVRTHFYLCLWNNSTFKSVLSHRGRLE